MNLKVKFKVLNQRNAPIIVKNGEWFDLSARKAVTFNGPQVTDNGTLVFDHKMVSLGIAMQLPKEFEAIVVPRSSLFKKKGLILANSIGVIDSSYAGNEDIWGFPAIALKATKIESYDRIAQFRIQPSQKASILTKLKWLFISSIEFVQVDDLAVPNRSGFGNTGGYKEGNK